MLGCIVALATAEASSRSRMHSDKRAYLLSITTMAALLMLQSSCKKEEVVDREPVPRPIKIFRLAGESGDARPEYPGRIESRKTVELSFEVGGAIVDWNVEEGQRVRKGEVLARIDPADYLAKREAAQAQLRLSEAEYRRESKLFASGSGTQRDLDVAIRRRDVDRAQLRVVQKAVDDTKLRALFDGVIARRLVTDFRSVQPRQPVLLLQDDSTLEVVVDVPEGDIAKKRKERLNLAEWNEMAKPMAELSSVRNRRFAVKLKEFATAADPSTRTFRATFTMERPEDIGVLAGMTAKVILTGLTTTVETDFLIPAGAVVSAPDETPFVWLVDEESMTVSAKPVEVGAMTGDQIVITDGLSRGDAVAMSGVQLLTEGAQVREMKISDETRR